MMRRLVMLALTGVLSGCDSEPAATTGETRATRLSAAETSVVDAEIGLSSRSAAGTLPQTQTGTGEDGGIYAPTDLESLEAELAALPPIRTGPMASVTVGDDPLAGELASERQMQRNLPRANHPLWTTLRQTRISIDERTQLFRAAHPASVRSLAGSRVTVRGYMLPLESSDRTRHFLVSPYTPVCFFHPPAEPNEVIEVRLSRPIDAGYHLVEVSGVLTLADNGEKGLFFVIDGGQGQVVERIE